MKTAAIVLAVLAFIFCIVMSLFCLISRRPGQVGGYEPAAAFFAGAAVFCAIPLASLVATL